MALSPNEIWKIFKAHFGEFADDVASYRTCKDNPNKIRLIFNDDRTGEFTIMRGRYHLEIQGGN